MSENEQNTIHQLLLTIEMKDRRFRIFQTAFFGLLLILMVVGIYVAVQTLNQVNSQQYRTINYLRCTSLIPPEDRTPAFVDRCLNGDSVVPQKDVE